MDKKQWVYPHITDAGAVARAEGGGTGSFDGVGGYTDPALS